MNHVAQWKDKVEVCRNYSTMCAPLIPNASLDFVYLDARHDYKGVTLDLEAYWPKVKDGGIFAGHDYVHPEWVKKKTRRAKKMQDWSINYDGTKDTSGLAVIGAVNHFAAKYRRRVHVTFEVWPSWIMRK